ncbi:MAG: hypothetical protein LBN07_04495 [Christensenellaceae bacterium]|jgi:hypothetical protein|nr:hypothetical protein [Christensenellaceae bacterium]
MKKLRITTFIIALAAIISFSLVGCAKQTFDDIAYGDSTQAALSVVQSFNNAKTGMFNKIAEYETTDINETLSGTVKTVKISKFGRIAGVSFTQQKVITYSGDTESYVTTTHYNGVIYTDTNGTVIGTAAGSAIDIPAFISSFIPSIGESTPANATLVEEKQFEEVNYFRLTIAAGFINTERPQQGNLYIDEFKYEFGIHAQNNYLMMHRTIEVIVTDTPSATPGGNYWMVSSRHTITTILKNTGENVHIEIPVVS